MEFKYVNRLTLLWIALVSILSFQCSTKKNTAVHRTYHNITAHYNAYFNGNESLKEGERKLETGETDDYTQVLKLFKYGDDNTNKSIFPEMDVAILKASKVIQRHEIKRGTKGSKKKKKKSKKKKNDKKKSKNIYKNWIDDSYLLMGKAHFYKRDFTLAIESFEYVAKHYKKHPIKYYALLWMIKAYNEMGQYSDAQGIWDIIEDKKIAEDLKGQPNKFHAEMEATKADYLLKQERYGPAIKPLKKAISLTKKKKQRVRYTYILAQLYQKQRDYSKASILFDQVLNMNPSYEMAFNAQINKAKGTSGSIKEIRRALEKMLTDEKNSDYFDQVYFALADLAQREGNNREVIKLLKLSVQASKSNNKQKGLSFLRLADIYFEKPEYTLAEAYYDSAATVLPRDFTDYETIINKKNSLQDIVKYLTIIAFEDSVQMLAGLSSKERNKIIDGIIERVIEQEEQEKEEKLNPYRQDPLNAQLQNNTGSQWYFYNASALSFGYSDFSKKWGQRKLGDNWRRKDKNTFTVMDEEDGIELEEELEEVNTEIEGDPKAKSSYLKLIPLTQDQMIASHNRIIEAFYHLGIVYKELLMDEKQSINTFTTLLDRYPDNKYKLSTLYQLYRIYQGNGQTEKAKYYKELILNEFPDSDYARIIKDPSYLKKLEAQQNKVETYYKETYINFKQDQYGLTISRCDNADSIYSGHPLIPKFNYLKALAIGKSQELPAFETALNEVIKKHPNNDVKKEAEATLAFIEMLKNAPVENDEDTETESMSENIYQFDKEKSHYYVLIIPDSTVVINKLKKEVSNYNNKFFRLNRLTTNNMLLDNDLHLIVVKKFNEIKKGMEYYRAIDNNPGTFSSLPTKNMSHFIISSENFPVFYKDKKIDQYLAFFKNNYLL